MSALTAQTVKMVEMLPDEELSTVNSLLKMILRSWDPEFTKVTPEEYEKLLSIEKEMDNGEFFTEEDVWN